MKEIAKLVVVLGLICGISGFVLAYVKDLTKGPIEYAKIKNVKEPAVKAVLGGYDNDPIKDRISFPVGADKYGRPLSLVVFPAKKGGKTFAVAFESSGNGYKGPIGVMVGIDVDANKLTGISVVGHTETPGLGARILETSFTDPFKGQSLEKDLGKDNIQALSGATLSTNGVLAAVNAARETLAKHRDKMVN
ncbi:MAG: RnfABCDGE type electron transport complex subunit G [Pseudomonadota bacterium]